jgi:hypothetical protein
MEGKFVKLHPLLEEKEVEKLIWKLARQHGYRKDQNAILFQNDGESSNNCLHINHKQLLIDDLFDWQAGEAASGVTQLPGYPFSLLIGLPQYQAYFHPDYPHSTKLSVEVTFIYHALQLLNVGGLLIILASLGEKNWPVVDLDKIAQKIDEYVLSPEFGSPVEHALMVFRRKATDAVRYEPN